MTEFYTLNICTNNPLGLKINRKYMIKTFWSRNFVHFEMKTVLLYVFFACCLDITFGYCYLKPEGGDHCTPKDGVTMLAGSELLIPEKCEKCTCSYSADGSSLLLSCCGYGKSGGVIAPPPGCKMTTAEDGCSIKIVQAIDPSQPCIQ